MAPPHVVLAKRPVIPEDNESPPNETLAVDNFRHFVVQDAQLRDMARDVGHRSRIRIDDGEAAVQAAEPQTSPGPDPRRRCPAQNPFWDGAEGFLPFYCKSKYVT